MLFSLIVFILLSRHAVNAGVESDLCAAVAKAQEATMAMQTVASSLFGTNDLNTSKSRLIPLVNETVKALRLPYSLAGGAFTGGSPLTAAAESCLKNSTKPTFEKGRFVRPSGTSTAYESMKFQYNLETLKLAQVEHDRHMFTNYPSATTFTNLRRECDHSQPRNVVQWLHNRIVTTSTIPNLVMQVVQNNVQAWRSWAVDILSEFTLAMTLDQICMAVKRGNEFTATEMDQAIDQQIQQFTEVFDKMIEDEDQMTERSG